MRTQLLLRLASCLLLLPLTIAAESPASFEPTLQYFAAQPNEQEEILYAAPTTRDRIGRVMVPVFVNGRGPYAFIIDSGASRSAITPRVAAELGLVPDPTEPVILRGVTGVAEVPSIRVERLQAGDIVLRNQRLPVVTGKVFADADGILGVDGFEQMCLHADFTKNRISITRNKCSGVQRGWIRIPVLLRPDRLVRISGSIRSQAVHVIIDTGAARSLGNQALLRALALEHKAEDPRSDTRVLGATPQETAGNLLFIPVLNLGRTGIRNMRVTFGDLNVFEVWDLIDEPAIVVGMDVLGTFDALKIDYTMRELDILPKGARDRPPTTGSRLDR